ncbi:MAG: hypothetical protein CVT63_04460 [Candidatus Anoxymicrobium japonicum]|uniref:Uncharacterized protein n=1 Tax=Candidatus Anoxymicrobium japonicum TaxID=2013648 RepID=A0A2N3G5Z6_9ACTN|nr:MAG: hypothetical protein CVT63_04460 [Candidatus Anoxymicrobium japonicum]
MDDFSAGAHKNISRISAPEVTTLRHELVEFLRENEERMISELVRVVDAFLSDHNELTPAAHADFRQSFHDFYQLYMNYFKAAELSHKRIKSFVEDLGRKYVGQGVELGLAIDSFNAWEDFAWDEIVASQLPNGYSGEEWVDLASSRDSLSKLVSNYMRRAYHAEEQLSMKKQLEEFRALSRLGQTIVSTVDLERVLGQILDVATSLLQTRIGVIMLLDETGNYLYSVVDIGLSRIRARGRIPVENTLAGVAIKRNEYVLARDDELAGFDLPKPVVGHKLRSALSIPVLVDEEPIGVIELYETTVRAYTDLDITMLTTLGPQAGIAIKNARLFNEERRRRRQAITMREFAQLINEARDLDELLEIIAEKTLKVLMVDRCSLFLFEPETNDLTFMVGYGRNTLQAWVHNRFHIPVSGLEEATSRALRERVPVLIENIGEEASLELRIFKGARAKSCLQIPLVVKDDLVGLMSLESTSDEARFGEDAITLADSFAKQAAGAIQNRRLREKLFEQQLTIKNAEVNEKLYHEREKSEAVLKATPDAVFMIDREKKIVFVNPAAEFLIGWSQEETRGLTCHEAFYGSKSASEMCPNLDCPINRMFNGERVNYSEGEIVNRSGKNIPVNGTFTSIIGQDGKIENVVAMYRDISEQKELEKYALIQRDMEIAADIQSSLLPREALLASGVRVHARQRQAREVGGDWFDYWREGEKVFLEVGDASGHGIGAALLATMAINALRGEARRHNDILEVMEHVNTSLYLANRSESFVTVFFGVLDLETMTLSYASAGHEEPLIVGVGKPLVPLTSKKRSLLGIFSRMGLDVQRRKLDPGDRIVVFTDGVVDAKSSRSKRYGLKQLNRFVAANHHTPPEKCIDLLIENVLDFCGGELKDDITVMTCDIPY